MYEGRLKVILLLQVSSHDFGPNVCYNKTETHLLARGDRTDFTIIFYQYIKVAEASYSYTELELVAEISGYVGLFLGVSVLDINQIFSKLLNYMKI